MGAKVIKIGVVDRFPLAKNCAVGSGLKCRLITKEYRSRRDRSVDCLGGAFEATVSIAGYSVVFIADADVNCKVGTNPPVVVEKQVEFSGAQRDDRVGSVSSNSL